MEQTNTYLKTVPFTDFLLWDVKRYNYVFNSNFDNAVFLKDILKPYKERLSKEELIENDWRIIKKINFQGELFLRDKEEVESYKGSLNKVPDNSIIYSKINVRHGCIYYHKTGEEPFGVSSEYPTFTFNENKVDGKYLMLVLRSNEFKRLLNTKASGISKARVKVDEFLGIKIPLPPLPEQNRIVAQYNQKIQLAEQQEQEANDLEQEIEAHLYKTLGVPNNAVENKNTKLKFLMYSSLYRWDGKNTSILKSKYKLFRVADLINNISTGTTPPTNRNEYFESGTVNFYTPADLTDKKDLFNADRKVTELAIKENKARRFIKDTLLFVGIGSTVGKVGIIKSDYATSNQQITGVYFDFEKVDINYIYYFFNYFQHITTSEQTQSTIPIVNQNKILNIQVPIPDKKIQLEIVNHIDDLKSQIKTLKIKVIKNREEALLNFEQEIFNA